MILFSFKYSYVSYNVGHTIWDPYFMSYTMEPITWGLHYGAYNGVPTLV